MKISYGLDEELEGVLFECEASNTRVELLRGSITSRAINQDLPFNPSYSYMNESEKKGDFKILRCLCKRGVIKIVALNIYKFAYDVLTVRCNGADLITRGSKPL